MNQKSEMKSDFLRNFRISLALASTKFKLRIENKALGVLWYFLDPIILFVIILNIQHAILSDQLETYPLYLFIGLIIFSFFRRSTGDAIPSISQNGGLIKSLIISKEPFVIANVLNSLISHLFEVLILIGFLFYFDISILRIFYYLPILFVFYLFIQGLSFFLATLGTHFGDLKNAWDIFTRLLWFATPIFHTLNPGNFLYRINQFNPIYYFIKITRVVIIDGSIPQTSDILIVVVISIATFIIGLKVFNKFKNKFAENL